MENVTMSREALRKQLKEQTEQRQRENENPILRRKMEEERREKQRDVFFAIAIGLVLVAAVIMYMNNYKFRTYSIDYTIEDAVNPSEKLYPFKDGNMVLGNDRVAYLRGKEVIFTTPIFTNAPQVCIRGNYFAFYDKGGYSVHVCDETGVLSEIEVSRKIFGMDVSEHGVVAIFTESKDAAYVSYFDRYGNKISVEVKSVLNNAGYPVHISISPDGQKLLVLYYSTENGTGESRAVLYDFENGSEKSSYIVQTLEDYCDSDTFLVDSKFMDNGHAVIIGDNRLSFLNCENVENVRKQDAMIPENIRSVFFTDTYLGVITEKEQVLCRLFKKDGSQPYEYEVPQNYGEIQANDRYLYFRNGRELQFFNISGMKRYEGKLVTAPESTCFSDRHSILINNGSSIQKITLK